MKKNIIYTLLLVLLVSLVLPATNTEASSKSDRQTLKDYAFLSMMSYDESLHKIGKNHEQKWIASINGDKDVSTADKKKYKKQYELLDIYYAVKDDGSLNDVSVYSILVRDKNTDEYIVVFRGSEDIYDWKTNARLAFGFNSRALSHTKEAVDQFKKYINTYTKSPTLTFVGHSLGGALAQHATVYTINKKLTKASKVGLSTYNAPTFSNNIEENKTIKNKLNTNKVKHLILISNHDTGRNRYIADYCGNLRASSKLGVNSDNLFYLNVKDGNQYSKRQMDKSKNKIVTNDFNGYHGIKLVYKAISMK